MKLELKPEFIEKYKTLTDFKEFETIINTPLRKCIRINTLKKSVEEIKKQLEYLNLKSIPWFKEGFFVESEEKTLGNLYEHKVGYIFVQEAASMIPPVILDPKKEDTILDACAAPGSKSTQIAQMINNQGIIIANDKTTSRIKALSANMQRMGVTNTIITISDVRKISHPFTKILLDAPCSSTGTIRGFNQKTIKTVKTYKPNLIKSIAGIQKNLIKHAYGILEPKGTLVYSTCSLEPEEDEGIIQHLLESTSAKLERPDLKIKSQINLEYDKEYSSELKKCIKLWPQVYDTQGFFIAKIRKP